MSGPANMIPDVGAAVDALPVDEAAEIVLEFLKFARPYLDRADITEIAVNRPGELWFEAGSEWQREEMPNLTLGSLKALSTTIASYCESDISESRPILSAMLPYGERIQIVYPPACESGTVAITIRKPSNAVMPLGAYGPQGYFRHVRPVGGSTVDKEDRKRLAPDEVELLDLLARAAADGDVYETFLSRAVKLNKCIVVCGETGSGKTTLMKSLMQEVPTEQRIVTIEDTPELVLPLHPNHVHLRYDSEASDEKGDLVTATSLLRSCMRMKPSRIMLAELRGGETYDFLSVAASGHGGSITSCHAGGCEMAFHRLSMMVLQNRQGRAMPYETIDSLLLQVVDIVLHVHHDTTKGGRGRHVTELWYDPMARRKRSII